MNPIVAGYVLNAVASFVLQGISHAASAVTPAERPLSVRFQVTDSRYVRRWSEPLEFGVSVLNTGTKALEFPWGITLRKDLHLCYLRAGGVFLRNLTMRSSPDVPLELEAPRLQVAPAAKLTKSYKETPLAQIPTAGLFWTWAEVRPRPVGLGPQKNVPRGTFRSNPVLIWWRTKSIGLAAELKQIGQAIRRQRSAAGPARTASKAAAAAPAIVPLEIKPLASEVPH